MTQLTEKEQAYLDLLRLRLKELHNFLNTLDLDNVDELDWWLDTLREIRIIQGNTSNDLSLIACLLAKRYLSSRHLLLHFDAAAKPQGAPGLDIDIQTEDGQRIIGEIKTTIPYSGAKNDLGANQKASFLKDFEKLNKQDADHKYFFVTDHATFEVVNRKYLQNIPGVEVVLLQSVALDK